MSRRRTSPLFANAVGVLAALSLSTSLRAQSGTIRGIVVDTRTGRALPYGAVAIGNTERFTTDSGRFVFTNVYADRSCTAPGAPRPEVDSTLAAAFQHLEQNAQPYRLITRRYPFESTIRQVFWYDSPSGPAEVRERVAKVRSDGNDNYEPGHAIVDHGFTRAVVIPTLAIFTDRAFVGAHGFRAGGMEVYGDESRRPPCSFAPTAMSQ